MRIWLTIGLITLFALGCASQATYTDPAWRTTNVFHANPILLAPGNHEFVWEQLADTLDDYFVIESEEPVRKIGDIYTEGRMSTFPRVGATIFEPWHRDSASSRERLESTLQSIRRYAVVQVRHEPSGFWVDVAVFKELEDVAKAEHSTAGSATLRYDTSPNRIANPNVVQDTHAGWINQGRDTALEQRILSQLVTRIGTRAMMAY